MVAWLIPCSPSVYDAEGAFQEYGHVVWHQNCKMQAGDIAYIYISAPIKEICCKCIIEDVDIPLDVGDDDGYVIDEMFSLKSYRRFMDLKMIEIYDNPLLGLSFLKMNGLGSPIQGQRRAPQALVEYIEKAVKEWKPNNALGTENRLRA